MTNSVNPDQTAPIGAVCSGSTLFASILNLSVMLGNYLQQPTFSDAFFLGALRVNRYFCQMMVQMWHFIRTWTVCSDKNSSSQTEIERTSDSLLFNLP